MGTFAPPRSAAYERPGGTLVCHAISLGARASARRFRRPLGLSYAGGVAQGVEGAQRAVVALAVAALDQHVEALAHELRRSELHAVRFARAHRDVHVLAVQPRLEPGVEGAIDHPLAVHLEDLALREAAEQRRAHLGRIDAFGFGERERLGDRFDRHADDDLVARLRDLAGAQLADVNDVLTEL